MYKVPSELQKVWTKVHSYLGNLPVSNSLLAVGDGALDSAALLGGKDTGPPYAH